MRCLCVFAFLRSPCLPPFTATARVTARLAKAGAAATCVFQPTFGLAICGMLDYSLLRLMTLHAFS
eukprot:5761006-Lingulodinium_polyedra.AAC.1